MDAAIFIILLVISYVLYKIYEKIGVADNRNDAVHSKEYFHQNTDNEDEERESNIEKNLSEMWSDHPSGFTDETEYIIKNNRRKYYTINNSFKFQNVSTLNPIFSEAAIDWQILLYNEDRLKVHDFFDQFRELEKKEIQEYSKQGGEKKKFKPSEELMRLSKKLISVRKDSENEKIQYQKMIEANIKVQNGESIDEVEKNYYKETESIPLGVSRSDQAVIKESAEFIKDRNEYWQKSWDRIVANKE